jgi:copper chaperone
VLFIICQCFAIPYPVLPFLTNLLLIMTILRLTVPNMACGACAETITQTIQSLDPTAKVTPNLDTKLVEINANIHEVAITAAIKKAGYTVQL